MEITIREATIDDLKSIAEMSYKIDRFYQSDLHLFEEIKLPTIEQYIHEHTENLAKPNYVFYVASVDNQLVGYTIGYTDNDIYKGTYGVAEELFVLEEYRKNGIAKMLMDKREEFFKSKNIKTVITEIFNTNKRSLDIHYKDGYKFESDTITLVKTLN